MPFQIVRNDITKMNTQAIVNCANEYLMPTGGVSSAIFYAAGFDKMTDVCRKIGRIRTGSSVITSGYDLCPYIIHTAGPVWHGGFSGEKTRLKNCYESVLQTAFEYRITSIAFPLISSGSFGFPKQKAIDIAMKTIKECPYLSDIDVYLCLFDDDAVTVASKFHSVKQYIDSNYIDNNYYSRIDRQRSADIEACYSASMPAPEHPCACISYSAPAESYSRKEKTIEEMLDSVDESFSQSLLRLIDEKGMNDVEVYKRANIDRKLFSKIRNNPEYRPKKNTVIAFAIALRLNLTETNALLGRAGYVLSHSSKADIIIEYFINKRIFDIFEINEALFAFDQTLLGV